MKESDIKIIEKVIQVRKDMEHGSKKTISGKELDELIVSVRSYMKMLDDLFKKIQGLKEEDSVVHAYENIVTVVRDVLRLEGVAKAADSELIKLFDQKIIHKGLIGQKYVRILKEIFKAKADYDAKKLTKNDIIEIQKKSRDIMKVLIEYIQRSRGRELERAKIRVKHGKRYGEVLLLEDYAYVIHDIDNEQKEISKANVDKDGNLIDIKKSSLEEMEKSLMKMNIPPKVFIKEKTFENS